MNQSVVLLMDKQDESILMGVPVFCNQSAPGPYHGPEDQQIEETL